MAWPSDYTLYDQITIDPTKVGGSGGTISAMPVLVSGATLSSQFWANVRADGGDIRASLDDGTTEIPVQVVFIDTGGQTAEIWLKADLSQDSNTVLRLWYNGTDTMPAVDSTYGSEAVWTSNYAGVYHLNEAVNNDADGYKDATSGDNHMTGTSMALTAPTGKFAGKCAEFDGSADFLNRAEALATAEPFTLSAWINSDSVTVNQTAVHIGNQSANLAGWRLDASGAKANDPASAVSDTGTAVPADSATGYTAGTWFYFVGVFTATNSRSISLNGAAFVTNSSTSNPAGSGPNGTSIGARRTVLTQQVFDGKIDEVRIATVARNIDWIVTEFNNQNDPGTFYAVEAMGGGGGGGVDAGLSMLLLGAE